MFWPPTLRSCTNPQRIRSQFDPQAPATWKRVEEIFRTEALLWRLRVAGQEIETTAEHPFWVEGKGWTAVKDLDPGERLRGHDGQLWPVEAVTATTELATVYNCRIADYHTYFVQAPGGAAWLWAHNACSVYREIKNGVVKYVGITGNFTRRAAEHRRIGRVVKEIKNLGKITRKQARALEHLLIERYGRIGKDLGGTLTNINRGIDPRKLGKYAKELEWAKQKLPDVLRQMQ